MKLILYHFFGEKFIAFLMLVIVLEVILLSGLGIYVVVRLIQEEFSRQHPKK